MADKIDLADISVEQAYDAGFNAGREVGAWSMLAVVVLIAVGYYFW